MKRSLLALALAMMLLVPGAAATEASENHSEEEERNETAPEKITIPEPEPITMPLDNDFQDLNCDGIKVAGVDSDGDGDPDATDPDDDCDYLSDDVEDSFRFSTDSLDQDSDNDGVIDGKDLRPSGNLDITVQLSEFAFYDTMDCCPGHGDPYLGDNDIQLRDNGPVVASFSNIPDFTESDHKHDQEVYTYGFSSDDSASINDNVAKYGEETADDWPQVNLDWKIIDHDFQDDDNIDVNNAVGFQNVATMTTNLHFLADSTERTFVLDGKGGPDDDGTDSGRLEFTLESSATECAVEAATDVRHSDGLITASDLTC